MNHCLFSANSRIKTPVLLSSSAATAVPAQGAAITPLRAPLPRGPFKGALPWQRRDRRDRKCAGSKAAGRWRRPWRPRAVAAVRRLPELLPPRRCPGPGERGPEDGLAVKAAPQLAMPRRFVLARRALTRLPFLRRHGRRAVGGPGAAAMEESA